MRRFFSVLMIHMICACLTVVAEENLAFETYRDIPGITAEEISAVESLKSEFAPFTYGSLSKIESSVVPNVAYTGFTDDFYTLLSTLFETEFSPVYCDEWDSLVSGIDSGSIEFAGIFTPLPSLNREFITSKAIAGCALNIYTPQQSHDIRADSDIRGHKIGYLSESSVAQSIEKYYPQIDFEPIAVNSFTQAVESLNTGEIDALVVDAILAPKLERFDFLRMREIFPLIYSPVALSTLDTKFAPIITVFDKYLKAGGANKLHDLYVQCEKDYEKYKLFTSFTAQERAYIANRLDKDLTVDIGLQHDAYPVSFYNKNSNQFQGVAIDILKEITELTGLRFSHITTSTDTPISIILEKLKSGEISMMTQLLYSDSRKNDYLWSNAYLETNYALLSKSDFPQVEIYQIFSHSVGTVQKTAHEEMFETWFPNHDNQIVYPTTDAAFTALESGEIDLLMLSENMLLTQTNYREKPEFKINIDFYVPLESYFGFTKSEQLLRSIVNKSMEHIKLDDIGSKWLNLKFDYTKKIREIQTYYLSVFTIVLLLVLIGLICLFLSNKKLSKNLADRSATLSTILSSIPDTVFCKSALGTYTSCNLSFEKQAGMSEAQLVGKTYTQVFKERAAQTAKAYEQLDQNVLKYGKSEIVEESVLFPDGTRRTLETLKAPLMQNGKIVGLLGIGRDVTERKEIKTRIDRIINTAQFVFLMTINNKVVEANDYSKKHIGVEIGDDIREFYGNPQRRDDILQMAKKHGTVSNVTVLYKTTTGEVHRFLSSFTLVEYEQQNAYILWAIDIERDEQINDQLRAAQQSLQTIMDTLPIPVCIVDVETGEMVYGNKTLANTMGLPSTDAVLNLNGNEVFAGFREEGANAVEFDNYLSKLQEPVIKEITLYANNPVEVRAHAARIDYYGRKAIICFMSDLTNEKETQKMLIAAAAREKEANQSKSLFLASMSHEIRTPMNGVIGMTDLLLGEKLSGRQLQYAKDIKTSAQSLLSIINNILDFSKISEGKLQITPVDFDLSLLLQNTISMIRFTAGSKGLEFVTDIQLQTPEYVHADDVRFNQVLVNLLSNAVKFTKKGQVKLSMKIEDGNICYSVSDTGIGIKKEDIPLIFEVFGQVDRHKNRTIRGTGLGLSISQNLVDLMGGRLWVESEYGVGSTFYVNIPHIHGNEAAVEKTELEYIYVWAPRAQVLIVDDIQTNLTVGAGLLRLCGITADVAISGRDAIELMKEKDYDIVFMDHMMPEMDGIETMNIIKTLGEKYSKIPIIALTANAMHESRDFLLEAGMDDFVAKPIDIGVLMNVLTKWLPPDKVEVNTKSIEHLDIQSDIMKKASEIEGLNIELALSRIGGMQDVLETSIKQLSHSLDDSLKEMGTLLENGDLLGFASIAHGLKGALANIGAIHYSELAAELEIAAKAENTPLCVGKFSAFERQTDAFAQKLRVLFEVNNTAKKPVGDVDFLRFKCEEVLQYVSNFEDAQALECLTEISKYTFDEKIDTMIEQAVTAIEAFDYEKTTLLVQATLESR